MHQTIRILTLAAAMVLGVTSARADGKAVVKTVAAAASGTCGKSDVNGGANVVWSLYDMDGNATFETLTISQSAAVSGQTDFTMADWVWDGTNNTAPARPWSGYSAGITSVVVGEGVESVGDYSFYGLTALTSVSLGSSVARIGDYAFELCSSLARVDIPAAVVTIGYDAFYDCAALTTVSGGSGLTRVGYHAFYNTPWFNGHDDGTLVYIGRVAYELKGSSSGGVTVKDGTVAISDGAFIDKGITSITLPEGLEYIGTSAFHGCSGLESVTIPSTVSYIGYDAFTRCDVLSSVYLLPETPPRLEGNDVFSGSGGYPLADQHFYVASEAYLAKSSNDWYTMWRYMAGNGWQKTGESNASTADAIASGVSLPAATVSVGGVTTKYFTFAEAFAAAKAGYKSAADNGGTELVPTMTLTDNVDVGEACYYIGDVKDASKAWSLALDLNGHTISTAGVQFLVVNAYGRLALFDGSTGGTKGSIVNTYSGNDDEGVITVGAGVLTAEGVTIAGGKLYGIYNVWGTVTVNDCTVSGKSGFFVSGSTTVSGGTISGTEQAICIYNGPFNLNTAAGSAACTISGGEYGILFDGGDSFILGSGVSISHCNTAGIKLNQGTTTFKTLPTFGTGDDKNGTDIWLVEGKKITFAQGSYAAPAAPITISLADRNGNEPTADALPKEFTKDYGEYVKVGNNIIDPIDVFAYKNTSTGFVVALKDNREAAIFVGKTFAFAEGQEWMTWCDVNDYTLPSGLEAYRITSVSATSVEIAAVEDNTIPAYTPLLLRKKDSGSLTAARLGAGDATGKIYDATTGIARDGDADFTFFGATQAVSQSAMNDLYTAGQTYMLRGGEFVLIDDITQGMSANRCWLTVVGGSGSSAARRLVIGGGTTGIEGVTPPLTPPLEGAGSWYDLQGRRISGKPTRKGIYLKDGSKHVIK